ncbi:hypothetical protein [Bdellovibrio sp. HCB337]|uniref:hypothetical protein n=1 Tax=Bdellovibrio sp. HCB337 TaxID=3394358 RepID=UPI0039A4F8EA
MNWRLRNLKVLIPLFVASILGAVSAFLIFAVAFNSASWEAVVGYMAVLAIGSGAVGYFSINWRMMLWVFFIPHLLLLAVLIKGIFETGKLFPNMALVALITFGVWLPAFCSSRIRNSLPKK